MNVLASLSAGPPVSCRVFLMAGSDWRPEGRESMGGVYIGGLRGQGRGPQRLPSTLVLTEPPVTAAGLPSCWAHEVPSTGSGPCAAHGQ